MVNKNDFTYEDVEIVKGNSKSKKGKYLGNVFMDGKLWARIGIGYDVEVIVDLDSFKIENEVKNG
jgi:hypothetical protein